jgi:hypothetical protein
VRVIKATSEKARQIVRHMNREARRGKYNAKPTLIDGIRFASQREGLRYVTLKQMERAGEISRLELQPKYDLLAWMGGPECNACGIVGRYIADFRYVLNATGETVIEDAKGFKTDTYKLKKKIVEANYGIKVREV